MFAVYRALTWTLSRFSSVRLPAPMAAAVAAFTAHFQVVSPMKKVRMGPPRDGPTLDALGTRDYCPAPFPPPPPQAPCWHTAFPRARVLWLEKQVRASASPLVVSVSPCRRGRARPLRASLPHRLVEE
jgi:hypothetical protein